MNKVILIGNLTKDPELTQTQSGSSICKFTLAVRRNLKNAEGEYDSDFLNIVAFKTTADICHKYLQKGNRCGIVGRIQVNSYNAQDGTKRYFTNIVVDEVEFLTAKSDTAEKKIEKAELKEIDDLGDNLPF